MILSQDLIEKQLRVLQQQMHIHCDSMSFNEMPIDRLYKCKKKASKYTAARQLQENKGKVKNSTAPRRLLSLMSFVHVKDAHILY